MPNVITPNVINVLFEAKIVNMVREYNQEIPQSQTAGNPMAPQGRATQPSRDTRKTNEAQKQASP